MSERAPQPVSVDYPVAARWWAASKRRIAGYLTAPFVFASVVAVGFSEIRPLFWEAVALTYVGFGLLGIPGQLFRMPRPRSLLYCVGTALLLPAMAVVILSPSFEGLEDMMGAAWLLLAGLATGLCYWLCAYWEPRLRGVGDRDVPATIPPDLV